VNCEFIKLRQKANIQTATLNDQWGEPFGFTVAMAWFRVLLIQNRVARNLFAETLWPPVTKTNM